PQQVKNVLKSTALDLNQDENSQGSGRVQAYDAFIKATGLEPIEPEDNEKEKQEAVRKSREEENVDEVKSVKEKESNNKEYYVVEGKRNSDNGRETVLVWINKNTGEIEKVEVLGFFKLVWVRIIEFFENIINKLTEVRK
ncbi:MAG: PepSY domain-containing protein, partial [Nanoarchaeota archaeon]